MKEMNTKKQKKKAIPHCFQKRSRSNTSLSQMLCMGTYKKHIKDLTRNNRRLAVELNVFRLENARLNNQLKDSNKNNHQMMFARLKLKEMANTIAKLVTDMAEVNSYLDGDWESSNLPEKVSHEKLKLKEPAVSCIEEASTVIETPNRENSFEVPRKSGQGSSEIDIENRISSELPPILFVEDPGEKKKTSSNSRKGSRRSVVADQESLTPKLDVDLIILNNRRTSSRRQTQKFVFPEVRKTRSRGKTNSSGRTTVSDKSTTPVTPATPPVIPNEESSPETVEIQNDKVSENIEQISCMQSTNIVVPNLCHNSASTDDHVINTIDSTHVVAPVKDFLVNDKAETHRKGQETDGNHTVLSCEDMELTDVVYPFIPITIGKKIPVVDTAFSNSGIKSNICGENDKIDSEKESKSINSHQNNVDSDLLKSHADMQNVNMISPGVNKSFCGAKPVLRDYSLPPSPKDSTHDQESVSLSKQNANNVSKGSEQVLNDSLSPFLTKLRHQKPINYKCLFFSDDSDNDSIIETKYPDKKKSNKTKNVSSARSSEEVPSVSTDHLNAKEKAPSDDANKKARNDISVYDLDVSNSKMKKSKKSKLQKEKKTTKKNASKTLIQNCRITKLKGGDYKFSKNETDKSKMDQLLKSKPTLESSLADGALNAHISTIEESEKRNQSTQQIKNVRKSILSANKYNDNAYDNRQQETPKSEVKRVSFAATDVICKYRKMSVSKDISENEKVRCLSKCADQVKGVSKLINKELNTTTGVTTSKKLDTQECLNSSEETELYTFPLNAHAVTATSNIYPLQKTNMNVKCPNEQGENSENKKIIHTSKHQENKDMSSTKIVSGIESCTAAEVITLKNVGVPEWSDFTDETELYTVPLNVHIVSKTNNFHPSLQTNNSSANEHLKSEQNKNKDLVLKSKHETLGNPKKQVSEENIKHPLKSDRIQDNLSSKIMLGCKSDAGTENVTERKTDSKELLSTAGPKLCAFPLDACVDVETEIHHPTSQPLPSKVLESRQNDDKSSLKKKKNKQKQVSENKKVRSTKFPNETEEMSKSNNILGKKTKTVTEIITSEKLGAKETNSSDESESHIFSLNSCVVAKTDDFHLLSQSTISSVIEQSKSEQDKSKDNLTYKSSHLITKTQKSLGKLSLKANKISQKRFSDKTMEGRDVHSLNANALGQVKDTFLSKFSCKDTKENEIHPDIVDIPEDELKVIPKFSKDPSEILPANECKISLETVHKKIKSSSKVSASKNNQSPKHITIQQSPNISPNNRKKSSLKFSPVLKDVINLEGNIDNTTLPKRRSRAVINYKEPSALKKLRRE